MFEEKEKQSYPSINFSSIFIDGNFASIWGEKQQDGATCKARNIIGVQKLLIFAYAKKFYRMYEEKNEGPKFVAYNYAVFTFLHCLYLLRVIYGRSLRPQNSSFSKLEQNAWLPPRYFPFFKSGKKLFLNE